MARWNLVAPTWSIAAVADGAAFTDNQHLSLQGGSASQVLWITDVYMGGLEATSLKAIVGQLARHSTVGATAMSVAAPGSMHNYDPSTAALAAPPVGFTVSTTKPQADAARKLLAMPINGLGGAVRKAWNVGEGPGVLGNTQPLGELGINGFTGTTTCVVGAHIEFEPK